MSVAQGVDVLLVLFVGVRVLPLHRHIGHVHFVVRRGLGLDSGAGAGTTVNIRHILVEEVGGGSLHVGLGGIAHAGSAGKLVLLPSNGSVGEEVAEIVP